MINSFLESEEYKKLHQVFCDGRGPVSVVGTVNPVKAQLIASLSGEDGWCLLVTNDESHAKALVRDLRAFHMPGW